MNENLPTIEELMKIQTPPMSAETREDIKNAIAKVARGECVYEERESFDDLTRTQLRGRIAATAAHLKRAHRDLASIAEVVGDLEDERAEGELADDEEYEIDRALEDARSKRREMIIAKNVLDYRLSDLRFALARRTSWN